MAAILLTQRFSPEKGGSISWWQELYQHWPEPFSIITNKYQQAPEAKIVLKNCSSIIRSKILMVDWGIRNFSSMLKYLRMIFLLVRQNKLPGTEIHCAHIIPEGLAALVSKIIKPRTKIIAYVHGEELLAYMSSRELRILFKLTIGLIDLFICNSNNTAKILRDLDPGIAASKVKVVPPCINYPSYQNNIDRQDLRRKYNLKVDDYYLTSVGRLINRKNQRAVIQALGQLRTRYPNLNYLCIGSGPEKENLLNLTQQLNLQEFVRFIEPVADSDKIELLQASDIFILPTIPTSTDIEGFGIALVEAQACGLPVICGNSGGESEAVKENFSALIIDGSKLSEITAAVSKILDNPLLHQILADGGKSNARQFDASESSKKIYSLVKELHAC